MNDTQILKWHFSLPHQITVSCKLKFNTGNSIMCCGIDENVTETLLLNTSKYKSDLTVLSRDYGLLDEKRGLSSIEQERHLGDVND